MPCTYCMANRLVYRPDALHTCGCVSRTAGNLKPNTIANCHQALKLKFDPSGASRLRSRGHRCRSLSWHRATTPGSWAKPSGLQQSPMVQFQNTHMHMIYAVHIYIYSYSIHMHTVQDHHKFTEMCVYMHKGLYTCMYINQCSVCTQYIITHTQ